MPLRHIVAATSDTDEGRAAVQTATSLAQRFQSKVTVLTIASEPVMENGLARLTRSLRETVTRQLETVQRPHPPVNFAIQFGLPGVEIGRFAESCDADLVIMGRREPSAAAPPGNGDTADAVARRSRVPCLIVQPGQTRFDHVLIALDGTERGLVVLQAAVEFARAGRARLRAVTVEPEPPKEEVPWVHTGRTSRVTEALVRLRRSGALSPEQWDFDPARPQPVLVRHGPVVEQLLHEVSTVPTDLLVFGCHRGGPSPATDSVNIPRQLMHHSPCAILTIPL